MSHTKHHHHGQEYYQAYPKVELHRHLEGSLRLETLREIAQDHGIPVEEHAPLDNLVQIGEREPFTVANFLSKFATLRLFYRSPEVITRITHEAIEDAARDNVRYMELRFTPVALSREEDFPLPDVIDWVIEAASQASIKFNLPVRLIASVNRHESPDLAEEVARLAVERMSRGIVGLDLAGNEADFSALPFAAIFREAQEAGLRITVHAGEWGSAANVSEAIEALGAERIGHGVRVLEDENAVHLARERGTTFEVCITSNYQSGVVAALTKHPLVRMQAAGLNVTINTDDPSISRITLGDEYRVAAETLGMSDSGLQHCVLQAARSAFLPPAEREALVAQLENEFRTLQADA
ncbi:MAG: adenosine deaminase [Anaerolineae bacterium]|nr:MAG: adenosine deaminase [Anaerolineae bacterium]